MDIIFDIILLWRLDVVGKWIYVSRDTQVEHAT